MAFSIWNVGETCGAFDKAKTQDRLNRQKYIASRYLVREYNLEEAKLLLDLAKKVLDHGKIS
ncbi:MAG: hypothetical protein ACUVQ8_08675 [Nitrososphaeria archaeon]